MAETDPKQQSEKTETVQVQLPSLKYLEFVQVAAVHAMVLGASIYNFAKENSGPLKPGVQTVEGAVKTVIGPVYEKFHDLPLDLLKFADSKVDGFVHEVDSHVPSLVKEVSSQAYFVAHKAPEVARSVASEVRRVGVMDTAAEIARAAYTKLQPTAKVLYVRYEPVAEKYAVWTWRYLNHLPLFPEVAHLVVPSAAYWSEKYNRGVEYMSEKEYSISAYMPLIPTERIAKVFGGEEGGTCEVVNGKTVSSEGVAVAGPGPASE